MMITMYQAELHSKLPRYLHRSEDILTSYVFSFFKYSNRKVFLFNYLKSLGINVSEQESRNAEFQFWPIYNDHTEPDLVLIVGDFYILIEAKYTSSFGQANLGTQSQLVREYFGGVKEAQKLDKQFILVTITAHPFFDPVIFLGTPNWLIPKINWTNWQAVTIFLQRILEENPKIAIEQIAFAEDLKSLLIHKRLRNYIGKAAFQLKTNLNRLPQGEWFFDITTAKYRGVFEGFSKIVSIKFIQETDKCFYHTGNMGCFFDLKLADEIESNHTQLFFRR